MAERFGRVADTKPFEPRAAYHAVDRYRNLLQDKSYWSISEASEEVTAAIMGPNGFYTKASRGFAWVECKKKKVSQLRIGDFTAPLARIGSPNCDFEPFRVNEAKRAVEVSE